MKIAAVVAEYNPFHNGHAYQLQKIKEDGIDCIIVIMSGNFVQRGIPSIYNMHDRAKMALENGADMIVGLPVFYSTGSAEFFAKGAINIIEGLGCVDYLYFGSELGEIQPLDFCAGVMLSEPELYKAELNSALKMGNSFPKARAMAVKKHVEQTQDCEAFKNADWDIEGVLEAPNNILGLEYIKELKRINSSITPRTIKRQGNGYNDNTIQAGSFASASGIREYLANNHNLQECQNLNDNEIETQVPSSVSEYINGADGYKIITQNDFSSMLYYQLVSSISSKSLADYYDMNQQISDIFTKNIDKYESWSQFVQLCKTKEYTYSRLNRCLAHILLQITMQEVEACKDNTSSYYARLLGFSKNGREIFGKMKKTSKIPLISKLSEADELLESEARIPFYKDMMANEFYNGVYSQKFHVPCINEFKRQMIKV